MRYRVTHYLVHFVRIDNLVSTTLLMWPETFLDRVTHYLFDFVRIDNLVSTTLKMWPDTFLDSSPSGVRYNLPCHFNQFFYIFQGFIELASHKKTKRSA